MAAREARGMSTEDIQRQLKLHPRQVDAIEAGDWASLPGLPFIRGQVRNYGKIVGVDVEPLLDIIAGSTKAAELRSASTLDEPLRPASMMGFGNGGSGTRWIWGLVGLAAAIALVLFFGREADLSKIPSMFGARQEAAASGADSGSSRIESVAINPPGGSALGSGDGSHAVPMPQTLTPAPLTPAPVPEPVVTAPPPAPEPPPPPPPPTGPVLKLSFDADAWVEVRQRNDNKVLSKGTQKAGTTMEVIVPVPVAVVIGNAEKVHAEFDGKALGMRVMSGTGVAKLNLP